MGGSDMFRCMFRSFFPIRLELIWSVLADKIFLDAWWWLQAFTLYKNALFMVEFDEESLKSVVIVFFFLPHPTCSTEFWQNFTIANTNWSPQCENLLNKHITQNYTLIWLSSSCWKTYWSYLQDFEEHSDEEDADHHELPPLEDVHAERVRWN
jgi:lysylphosphatidylglycerol synthetase-like protein (DUF2156 family)